MTDLITRLGSAAEGSRELSDEVLRAMGWRNTWPMKSDGGKPDPTRSVDDALALVPDGWHTGSAFERGSRGRWLWVLGRGGGDHRDDTTGRGDTPALALCAALLRMKENEDG